MSAESLTVSISEAADLLGVSRSLAYELVQRGEFPVTVLTIGRRRRVSRQALWAFVNPPTVAAPEGDAPASLAVVR